MQSASRVTFNTIVLYLRMLITVGISLYTTSLTLKALGTTDYGIFNLIAGIVVMFSFLSGAMATSTQRYLSYHQGVGNLAMQKVIFFNSFVSHILIGLIVIIGLVIASFFLFNGFLNIPGERIQVAKLIYLFVIASVFISILTSPFIALLNAHENMLFIAIVNIIEVLIKLIIAYIILHASIDKLFLYGILTFCLNLITFLLYMFSCFLKYNECSLSVKQKISYPTIKTLTSFAGWNLFGALCGVARSQGLAIILNLFFGAIINASYAIANQVAWQMNYFSVALLQALNPQIMKSEGAGDRQRMLRLSMIASKFGFFLLAIFAMPCIFEMPHILEFWLKNVPDNTAIFCNLILIGILANQLTIGIQSAIQATGTIKQYQIVVGSILLFNLPISYFLLKLGLPAYSALISFIIIELLACTFRLYFIKKDAGLSIKEYSKKVFLKEIPPVITSIIVCYFITNFVNVPFRFLITIIVSMTSFTIVAYWISLELNEKKQIWILTKRVSQKIKSLKFH